MKKLIAAAVLAVSTAAFAAPPPAQQAPAQRSAVQQPGNFGAWDEEHSEGRREEHEKRMRMMLVVGMAEALSLSEADAIRLADKIKAFDDRRKPLREQMADSMKLLKAASDGDQTAIAKVDQATATLFDLRQQMAAVDKEMFFTVSKDLTPQKRAQLAVFLAKFMHERRAMAGGGGPRGGRRVGG
jgi:hypothetical protein